MFKNQIKRHRRYKKTQITLLEMKTTLDGITIRLEIEKNTSQLEDTEKFLK